MYRLFLLSLLLTFSISGHAASGKNEQHTYLLLDMEFKLTEWNVVGMYPRLHGQAYLTRLAEPTMQKAVEEFTNGRLVTIDDINTDTIPEWNESIEMLRYLSRFPGWYFDPEDEDDDFFDDHAPDWKIGPVLADLEVDGKPVDRAILVLLQQLLVDPEKSSDFYAFTSDKSRLMRVCTFDLDNGELIWCSVRTSEDNLFDRNAVWQKDYYESEVKALFNDPKSTYYRRVEK